MYASALPTAGSFLLLFMPPENWSQPALFGYIVVVSILVRSFIALYEIPSSALGPELSADYDERTSIMAYRYMFAIVGGALLYIVTLKVFLRPEPGYPTGLLNPNGWWRYAVTASIIMALSILISAAGTHSRIPTFRKPVERPRRSLADRRARDARDAGPRLVPGPDGLRRHQVHRHRRGQRPGAVFRDLLVEADLRPDRLPGPGRPDRLAAGPAAGAAPVAPAGQEAGGDPAAGLHGRAGLLPFGLRLAGWFPANGSPASWRRPAG
jgi:hypothetical protein